MSESNEIVSLIKREAQNITNEMLRTNQVLVTKVAIIAQYDSVANKATVYFPTDLNNESSWYNNKTGGSLTVGQKVYVYHKYGDVEQGFISVGEGGAITAPYKYLIPRYQENLQITIGVDYTVTIPYSTGGYLPEKIVLYSRSSDGGYQTESVNKMFYMEIVKESNGTFTITSTAQANGTIGSLGLVPAVMTSCNTRVDCFTCLFSDYNYGVDAFLTSWESLDSIDIGRFSYSTTALTFIIRGYTAKFTSIDFQGFIY